MNASRAGFYWWELDLTYWVLRALALTGLVWDLRQVPRDVLAEGQRADDGLPRQTDAICGFIAGFTEVDQVLTQAQLK